MFIFYAQTTTCTQFCTAVSIKYCIGGSRRGLSSVSYRGEGRYPPSGSNSHPLKWMCISCMTECVHSWQCYSNIWPFFLAKSSGYFSKACLISPSTSKSCMTPCNIHLIIRSGTKVYNFYVKHCFSSILSTKESVSGAWSQLAKCTVHAWLRF